MGLSNYNGSVTLISGIRQANNGTFPLLEANAVQVAEDGTRLDEKMAELERDKVDKIDGKGLSTNDYTTEEKNKLENITEYTESEIQAIWDEVMT